MTEVDWIVLIGTLGLIVLYGTWKTRRQRNLEGYLRGGNDMNWTTIGLSVMATQASAITFISTPGQAYESGMGFVQNYFGLPIALIIVSMVFIPIYYRLKVYTAYEYLETRFGLSNRLLAAGLFLLQRGLAAGITIYAPAIILSTALGWNLNVTILVIGMLVIIYTVSGGTRAVSITQKWQMAVILGGMVVAFIVIVSKLPENVSFGDAVSVAGNMGKLNVIDTKWDLTERYTLWSGLLGGTFLALSYFGTDQSQVQRYISGRSVYESRMGLMFNALLKIPMQFFILFVGVLVFVFYQFQSHPVIFNESALEKVYHTEYADEMTDLQDRYDIVQENKQLALQTAVEHIDDPVDFRAAMTNVEQIGIIEEDVRADALDLLKKAVPEDDSSDSDYVFLSFIMNYLPVGLVGLLLAVIFSAAMSSTAGELNALATTSTIDFYKRLNKKEHSDTHYLRVSKLMTALWGLVAISFALFAYMVENLIEAVNILGSLFYGTILGIFLVAFFLKKVRGRPTFIAAIIAQFTVIALYLFKTDEIAYLFYNAIACILLVALAIMFNVFLPRDRT